MINLAHQFQGSTMQITIWIFQILVNFFTLNGEGETPWRLSNVLFSIALYVVATNKVKFSFHVDCFQIALFLQRCGSIMVYILGLNPPSFRCKKMKLSLNICYTMAKTKKRRNVFTILENLKTYGKDYNP